MKMPVRLAGHPHVGFERFLASTLCRAVARLLIVTLVCMDLPAPRRTAADADASLNSTSETLVVRYVNATDLTCQDQIPCYSTIQAAIDAAQPGDTVRVQAGEYDEALLIKKKQDLVIEADPAAPEGSVMLNSVSQRCGRGDVMTLNASADITIRGFTITDAGGQAIDIKGGSPKKHNEHIIIERNRIFGNGTSKCQGGIRVGPGTPDTVILNNLIYGNGQDAINFYGSKGGPHYVVQNVIHGNRRNGINVTKGQTVTIVNNLITHNGTDPKPLKQLFGVRRPAPKKKGRTENAQLLHNVICGNSQGELFGPMLDGLDAGSLTPTGSEGPGVTASPQCADNAVVYANVNGLDGQPNTKDDNFTLAVGSPAVDAGTDPRGQGMPIPDDHLEDDFFLDHIRPSDGDLNSTLVFDIGAVEGPGPGRQCTDGQTQACYEGPVDTQDVGVCRGGMKTCQPDGTYGTCLGQVLPQAEVCNEQDDDCNGQVDEGGVCPVNQPPDITSAPVTTGQVGQAYTYDVAATDPDNDPLTYALTTFPSGMTIDPDSGLIEWTPGAPGPHDVTVQVSDGHIGGTDTQGFVVQVAASPSAHAPVTLGNSYELRADQTLTIPAPGILGNDSDADQDALTAMKLSDPTKGELSFNSNGGFTFTPNPDALVCSETPRPTGVSFIEPQTTFATQSSGYGVLGLAKGDFNHDGVIDLAFTWYDGVPGVGERSFISTMLGNGDGSFQPSVLLHTVEPRYARGILAKDFDGDSELDLLVAAGELRQLLLFKGQGNGSFASPVPTSTTHRPHVLQSADVNLDGKLDLMTSNEEDNSVSVLLGNGDGTFQSPTNYAAGSPTELALGDVNGDLAPDVVVGSYNSQFHVLLNRNDGSGDLQPAQSFASSMQVRGLYVADFNSDNKLDVVASGEGCGGSPQTSGFGCMVFIPGNGNGTFPAPQVNNFVGLDSDFPTRRFSENVTPDLNGDGKLDVIFLGGPQTVANQAFVGLGNGDGTFALTRYVMSPGPAVAPNRQPVSAVVDQVYGYPVVTADFNGDGVVDLATGNIGGGQRPGGISLLPGATPGTFAAPRSFPLRFDLGLGLVARRSLALGDFTNDGQPELATLGVNHIGLVPLNGDGSLGQSSLFYATPGPGEFSHTLRTDDFDRDGNLDLLWLGTGGIQGGPGGRILVGFGDGTGHVAQVLTIPTTTGQLRNSVIEDFNADGFPDFAVYKWAPTPTAVEIYLSDGVTRTFSALSPAGGDTLGAGSDYEHGMVTTDFDNDEHLDIVLSIGVEGPSGGNPQRSILLKGNGDGTFQPGVIIASGLPVGGIFDYAAGDLNHDGKLDLVGNGIYGNAHVQLGNGDGTFQAPVTYFAGTGGNSGTTLADFDRDGHLDIAITGDNYGWGFVVFSGRGDGTFDAGQKFAVGQINASDLTVMDLNSDGKPDAIVGHAGRHGNLLTVLLNNAESGRLCTHTDSFTYKANDGGRDSNTAMVNLTILPVNHAPVITSTPVTHADTRRPYFYEAEAGDSDGGILTFALTTAPAGMRINPDTGVIRWIPASNQAGNRAVTVRVYDEEGLFDEQSFNITVTVQVTVPNVVGQTQAAAETAILGAGLTVGAITTSHSATVPTGNVISQTPAGGASVPSGAAVALVISLGPQVIDNLASILVEPQTPAVLVGQTQAFTATGILTTGASLDVTALVVWDSDSPSVATIASNGLATGVANGTSTIRATMDGIIGTAALTVRTPVTGDTTLPTAAITSPTSGAEVTSLIDVIGTAVDTNFFKYELAYAPAGDTNFTLLTSGASPVISDVLGQFDPTVLINDLYDLKLTVFDLGGNAASAMVTVQVAREKKVGLFSITFQDLSVPLSGLPITVNRTYDNRDKRTGDFGIGWRLDVQTLRIRTNRVLGTGWVRNPGSFATIVLSPTDQHKVSLTLPDGKVEEFDLQVSPTSGIGALDFTNVVGFAPRPGTLGTLAALANSNLAILNAGLEDELVDDLTFNTYNPQLFRYTTADGTQIEIHRTEGVKKITDLNGNTLTFGPNGIIHSAGKSVTFTRDAQNRITQITDPMGNSRTYAYDTNGDLVSATDFVGNTTTFTYNSRHDLLDIHDPTGARVARNEYDADGRLVATIDAQGHRVEFTHNVGASQEIVKDRLGNITVFEYDAVGNVVAKTDALGGVTSYTHDSRGNELTQTDPLGRVATRTYDSQNNILTSTDFDGNTTTSTYNSRGQVLTTTDPEGHPTTNVYDAAGNLTQTTDPEGGVTQHTYDAAGNRLTTTNPLGHVTTLTYDSNGNLTSETDSLGAATTFVYNANGTALSSTKAGRTTQYQHDAAQRLIATTDALGHQTTTTYSAIGDGKKIASVTDASGQVTQFDYDVRGHRTRTIFPDGSMTETTYDAEGHPLSQTDRDGRTFLSQYDALGRQTRTTNPDGTVVLRTYDAIGRLLTQTDERNNVTTHGYAPNMRTVTNALGQVSVQELDNLGRSRKTTDALGHVTTFAYDGVGNQVTIIFSDGTTKTTTYDAARRKIAETDQAAQTFQFVYDALGRLLGVTDPMGNETIYTYDALGNRLTQTDANAHTTQMTYDLLNRLTSRIRPLGQVETFAYDAKGNLTSYGDFNGETTTFVYEENDRLVNKNLPGGTSVIYAYSDGGLRTQAGGDSYEYDVRGRLTKETKASGEELTYTYDAAGNKTSLTTPQGTTTYDYDDLNRLSNVSDVTGTTTYTYDAVGNLASTAYPNGITTAYSYDTLNRLVQMTNTGTGGLLSSYTYTLGLVGNRLQVVEAGSAIPSRTVVYTYDAVYRLTQEAIDEPGTANDVTISYVYDAVGNRTQMTRAGVATTSSYDDNDRLTSETTSGVTTTYGYDANGSLLSKSGGGLTDTYTYDAEKRLLSATVQSGTSPGVVNYTYDADGMRTSKTAGSVTTTYLLDKNRNHAQVLVEVTGGTTVAYGYGHDLISQTRTGVGTSFYQYDGQLSTRQLTDTTGTVTDRYTYDAFGVLLNAVGATPNIYLYAGEQLDPNVGFYYLRARYYNQATGRFVSTDPLQGNAFDPVSLHRYLYANGNPVSFSDPSGQISTHLAVFFAVGVVLFAIFAIPELFARLGRSSVTARVAKVRTGGKLPQVDKAIANFIDFGRTPKGCSLQGQSLSSFLGGDQNCSYVEESLRAYLVAHRPADDANEYVRVNLFGKRTAKLPLAGGGNIDYHHAVGLRPKGSKGAPTLIFDPIRLGAFGRQAETGAFDGNSIFLFEDWYIAGSSRFGEVVTISAIDNATFFEDPEVIEGQGRFDQLKLTGEATPAEND